MPSPYKLLIADDRDEDTSLLVGSFADAGVAIEAVYAKSGDSLLEVLKSDSGRFDLALVDFYLPGKTALDVLCVLNAEDKIPRCPIAILTSHVSPVQRSDLLASGALGILEKPGDLAGYSALVAAIVKMLPERDEAA